MGSNNRAATICSTRKPLPKEFGYEKAVEERGLKQITNKINNLKIWFCWVKKNEIDILFKYFVIRLSVEIVLNRLRLPSHIYELKGLRSWPVWWKTERRREEFNVWVKAFKLITSLSTVRLWKHFPVESVREMCFPPARRLIISGAQWRRPHNTTVDSWPRSSALKPDIRIYLSASIVEWQRLRLSR